VGTCLLGTGQVYNALYLNAGWKMSRSTLDKQFALMQSRVQDVATLCERLRQENKALLEQQNDLVEERSKLIEKNEMARAKVEQMISRLKSMEASQ